MTTSSRGDAGSRRRAEFYEARARNYRRQAGRLLERDGDTDSASALLYEAAKQCVNAVANLRGENPATTGAKMRALRDIARGEDDGATIIQNWESAFVLHIHADRGFVADSEFPILWARAQGFVEAMLGICGRGG